MKFPHSEYPSLALTSSQMNPVHILQIYFIKIRFNIIIYSANRNSKWYIYLHIFRSKYWMRLFSLPNVLHAVHISQSLICILIIFCEESKFLYFPRSWIISSFLDPNTYISHGVLTETPIPQQTNIFPWQQKSSCTSMLNNRQTLILCKGTQHIPWTLCYEIRPEFIHFLCKIIESWWDQITGGITIHTRITGRTAHRYGIH
jgi:hypothetical protein